MKCPNCARDIDAAAITCEHCGHELVVVTAGESESAASDPSSTSVRGRVLSIAGAAAIIAGLVVGAVFFLGDDPPPEYAHACDVFELEELEASTATELASGMRDTIGFGITECTYFRPGSVDGAEQVEVNLLTLADAQDNVNSLAGLGAACSGLSIDDPDLVLSFQACLLEGSRIDYVPVDADSGQGHYATNLNSSGDAEVVVATSDYLIVFWALRPQDGPFDLVQDLFDRLG